jgi:hypothetical protein
MQMLRRTGRCSCNMRACSCRNICRIAYDEDQYSSPATRANSGTLNVTTVSRNDAARVLRKAPSSESESMEYVSRRRFLKISATTFGAAAAATQWELLTQWLPAPPKPAPAP